MTASARLSVSAPNLLRAPYAAPQGDLRDASQSASREDSPSAAVAARASDLARQGLVKGLVPFVPREFRVAPRSSEPVWPSSDKQQTESPAVPPSVANEAFAVSAAGQSPDVPSPAPTASVQAEEASSLADASAFVMLAEPVALAEEGTAGPEDLPWINVYVEDTPESEESWPLGEAGRRLDELTESLSVLDASRARQQAAEASNEAEAVKPAATGLPMWHEEDWMDIMPAPVTSPAVAETVESVASNKPVVTAAGNAEAAARALEGLAKRVREGNLPLPAFPQEMADEAVLAGVLASLLGWRR